MGKIYDQMHLAASVGIIKDEIKSIKHQILSTKRLAEAKELIDRFVEITETLEEELELAALKEKG
jgi:negative regulator of replication initiation